MLSARSSRLRALASGLLLPLALLAAASTPAAAQAPPPPARTLAPIPQLYFLGVPYGTTARTDPLYDETLFDLFYPVGGTPLVFGLTSPVMPLAILVHGGNTNAPLSGPGDLSALALGLLAHGFVVAIPSYHVLDLNGGESYLNATDDLARVVQFLRHYHTIVNVDPARVFCQGHSGGAFHAMYLGLNADFANPASPDPVLHESSRPDFLVPWAMATDWNCVDYANPATNQLVSLLVFGVADGTTVPFATKQAQSPTWWVSHPQLFGRTHTPPMCLVYNLAQQTPCGSIVNLHDGKFGVLMLAGIGRLCIQSGAGQPACSESVLIDSTDDAAATQAVVAWMAARAF